MSEYVYVVTESLGEECVDVVYVSFDEQEAKRFIMEKGDHNMFYTIWKMKPNTDYSRDWQNKHIVYAKWREWENE